MSNRSNTGIFEGTSGKLRLGALAAFLLSLTGFFLPISFEWNDYSNYIINWFIAAVNCENQPIFLMVLTGLALLAAIITVMTRKPLIAFIDGILIVILFVVLFLLVPDAEQQVYGGDVIKQIAIRPGAFFVPSAAAAGAVVSLITFLRGRKKKEE